MAKLRPKVSPAMSEPRLSMRGVDVWLTAADCDSLSDLLDAAAAERDTGKRWTLRQAAYRLYKGSWGFTGTLEDLLFVWAEDRRQVACIEWVRAEPGRTLEPFEPFGCDRYGML